MNHMFTLLHSHVQKLMSWKWVEEPLYVGSVNLQHLFFPRGPDWLCEVHFSKELYNLLSLLLIQMMETSNSQLQVDFFLELYL